jgi:hypothetical protein
MAPALESAQDPTQPLLRPLPGPDPIDAWLITFVALVAVGIAGLPFADVFLPRLHSIDRAALSLWLGFAGVTLSLLLVGLVVPYSRIAAGTAWLLTVLVGIGVRRAIGPCRAPPAAVAEPLFPPRAGVVIERAALALVGIVLLQVLLLGLETYISSYDFFGIWGLHTKLFFLTHGVDFDGLRLAHAYYPAASSMGHLWYDLWLGRIGDRYLSLPLAAEAAALVLVTRLLLHRLGVQAPLAAALTFFLCAGSVGFLFSALSGYGDLPMAAGLVVAIGAGAAWLRPEARGGGRWLALSGVGGGLAVWSKFEGLPSVALIAVALAIAWYLRGRRIADLLAVAGWVGLVALFAAPWYILTLVRHFGFSNEHVSGFYFHPFWILRHVGAALSDPATWGVWWVGAIALLIATAPAWLYAPLWRCWLGVLIAVELVVVMVAYVITVHAGRADDVTVTAPRLYFHLMPALVLALGCGLQAGLTTQRRESLVALLRRRDDATDESRGTTEDEEPH